MSRLGKTEKVIYITASLLLLVFSYFLYDDSLLFPKAHNENLKLVGNVLVSKNDVRRKNLDTFSWLPASQKDSVFQNDSIFTGDSSEATLRLEDGTQIFIQPNSLITLNMDNGQMSLDLRYGNLVGELAKNSALTIKSGSEEIKLEADPKAGPEKSKVQFKKSHSGTVDLKLLSGDVKYSDKKKNAKIELPKDDSIAVTAKGEIKKVERPNYQLSLAPGTRNWVRVHPEDPMKFAWTSSGPISRYEFELSPTEDFKTPATSKSLKEKVTQVTEPLEPGQYFIRVKAFDSENKVAAVSAAEAINISHMSPPQILQPQKSAILNLEIKVKDLKDLFTTTEFKWQSATQYPNYKWQLSQDEKFTTILKEGQTNELAALSPHLANGTYWVRVQGKMNEATVSPWSEAVPFAINLTAKMEKPAEAIRPILVTRQIVFKAPSPNDRNPAAEQAPRMEWKPVLKAKEYRVEIARDTTFKNSDIQEGPETAMNWAKFKNGRSYFRVFAKMAEGRYSASSLIGTIDVGLPNPVLTPFKNLKIVGDPSKPHDTPVSWTEVPSAASYLVQMDQNADFSAPREFEFKSTSGSLSLKASGSYKVRVKALDENSQAISDYSNVEAIEYNVRQSLQVPALIEPFNNSSIFLQKTADPSIWIEWRKVAGADAYSIEISDKEDFSSVLIRQVVPGNRFLIRKSMPLGKIYWRVRAQNKDESETSEWAEKREFTLYHRKNETFR